METRFEFARETARKAGKLVLDMALEGIQTSEKKDKSLVTTADLAADKLITNAIKQHFPQDNILSEESGFEIRGDSSITWVIDPIDGTKAYAAQRPGYTVMIGILDGECPVMGVVYDPLKDETIGALKGESACLWKNGSRSLLWVSRHREVTQMRVILSPSIPQKLQNMIYMDTFLQKGEVINGVGSKVSLLVKQEGDIYFNNHKINYWDSVAPLVIAESAGAKATLLDGRPFEYPLDNALFEHPMPSVFSNNQSHDEYRKLLQTTVNQWKTKEGQ